ncbi:MAG: hypothetical protein M5U28_50005 [Sandaracinaceae bacterium]|nr:hypothetical protein [Sandaracinaceae bacterium]
MTHRAAPLLVAFLTCACASQPPPVDPPPLDDLIDDGTARVSIGGIVLPRMPPDVGRTIRTSTRVAPREPGALHADAAAPRGRGLGGGGVGRSGALRLDAAARGGGRRRAAPRWRRRAWAGARRAWWPRRSSASPTRASRSICAASPRRDVFAGDPDRSRAFQEALHRATATLWQRALDAFGSCASAAGAAPAHSLDQWREFCDDEIESASAMLPEQEGAGRDDDEPDED